MVHGQTNQKDLPKGQKPSKVESEHFTYEVAQDTGNSVLIIANEDYTGVNPEETPSTRVRSTSTRTSRRSRRTARPRMSGMSTHRAFRTTSACSSHYDAVLWYLGDNRLTQDPEDVLTDTYCSDDVPDLSVAERQQYLTMAVRDFLNEGGKLVSPA